MLGNNNVSRSYKRKCPKYVYYLVHANGINTFSMLLHIVLQPLLIIIRQIHIIILITGHETNKLVGYNDNHVIFLTFLFCINLSYVLNMHYSSFFFFDYVSIKRY